MSDLRAILEHRLQTSVNHAGRIPDLSGPLTIHAHYTRDEILVGLGHWSLSVGPISAKVSCICLQSKVDAFFVTLQKTEEDYSPTTMYEDYLISHDLFHWQSQSTTSAESPTGQRYIHHRDGIHAAALCSRNQGVAFWACPPLTSSSARASMCPMKAAAR